MTRISSLPAGGSRQTSQAEALGVTTVGPTIHAFLIAFATRLAATHQVAPPTPNNKPTTWTAMTFTMVIDGKIIA
jgi:hypothetical protein